MALRPLEAVLLQGAACRRAHSEENMPQLDASNAATVDHDPLLSESSLQYLAPAFLESPGMSPLAKLVL